MRPDADPNDPTPGMHIWGWMSPTELRWLAGQAARMESVVEIGCLHGRSAYAIADACPGPVVCIDPWDDEQGKCFPSFMENVGYLPNVVAIRGMSPSVLTEPVWADVPAVEPFDMVFIDGAHAYESVLVDIAAWLPHTRKLICGHDYCNADAGYPGVAQAVDQVFGSRVFVPDGTSIWAVDLEADRSLEPGLPTGEHTWTDEYDRTTTHDLRWP